MDTSKENNVFYVYVHKTKDTGDIFYVGKGKKDRYKTKSGRNPLWKNIVSKHGFYSEKIMENLSETSAYIQEILAIKFYKPRANLLPGGTGGNRDVSLSAFIRNPELKNILSETQKKSYKENPERAINQGNLLKKRWENPDYKESVGNKISIGLKKLEIKDILIDRIKNARTFITEESKIKRNKSISKANRGKKKPPRTQEHIDKIAKSKTGYIPTSESRLKSSISRGCKPFQVFDKSGNFLGEWTNRSECARDLNLDDSRIGNCLKGTRKSHKGFIFKHK